MKNFLSILTAFIILLTGCNKSANKDECQVLFGGGCFWTLDFYLTKVNGVTECKCVYSDSGSEAVLVTYDPKTVSFPDLCDVFLSIHDPKINYKPRYRSVIQVNDEASLNTAQHIISDLNIPTKVEKLGPLTLPEEFHENWHSNKNSIPRCSNNIEKIKIFFK